MGTAADQGGQNARIRDTPSSASRVGDGEPESRRPQARNAGKRQKRTWHALQQADVEVHLVPLDDDALDLGERERGRRLPLLRRLRTRARGRAVSNGLLGTARAARTPGGPADLQDQVVKRVSDPIVCGKGRAVSNGIAWTTHGAPAFEASESYSGRRTRLQAGKKMFRKRAARGAAGSRLQSAPGKWSEEAREGGTGEYARLAGGGVSRGK